MNKNVHSSQVVQLEKLVECEYPHVDETSDPCHNPPVFIDRMSGTVVCAHHVEALAVFMEDRQDKLDAMYSEHLDRKDEQVLDTGVPPTGEIAKNDGDPTKTSDTPPVIPPNFLTGK